MCVQAEEPVDSPVRRITRSVAANSPKLAPPSLYSAEQKMSTPSRKIGSGALFCLRFHAECDANLNANVVSLSCPVCMTVGNEKAKSERRSV